MKTLLTKAIFLNMESGRFYLLFNNYVYQFNGEIIEVDENDIDILYGDSFITFHDIDIDSLYLFLKEEVDIYHILDDCNFYQKGRLVKILYNGELLIGVIDSIKENRINDIDDVIYSIDVLLESGVQLTIKQQYIHSNIEPLGTDLDIKIDGIIEVLAYYNMETLNVDFSEFIK